MLKLKEIKFSALEDGESYLVQFESDDYEYYYIVLIFYCEGFHLNGYKLDLEELNIKKIFILPKKPKLKEEYEED